MSFKFLARGVKMTPASVLVIERTSFVVGLTSVVVGVRLTVAVTFVAL